MAVTSVVVTLLYYWRCSYTIFPRTSCVDVINSTPKSALYPIWWLPSKIHFGNWFQNNAKITAEDPKRRECGRKRLTDPKKKVQKDQRRRSKKKNRSWAEFRVSSILYTCFVYRMLPHPKLSSTSISGTHTSRAKKLAVEGSSECVTINIYTQNLAWVRP